MFCVAANHNIIGLETLTAASSTLTFAVSRCCRLSNSWRWFRSELNPADLSRGLDLTPSGRSPRLLRVTSWWLLFKLRHGTPCLWLSTRTYVCSAWTLSSQLSLSPELYPLYFIQMQVGGSMVWNLKAVHFRLTHCDLCFLSPSSSWDFCWDRFEVKCLLLH